MGELLPVELIGQAGARLALGIAEMLGRFDDLIDPEEDSVAANTLHNGDTACRSEMGDKMNFTEKQQLFAFCSFCRQPKIEKNRGLAPSS